MDSLFRSASFHLFFYVVPIWWRALSCSQNKFDAVNRLKSFLLVFFLLFFKQKQNYDEYNNNNYQVQPKKEEFSKEENSGEAFAKQINSRMRERITQHRWRILSQNQTKISNKTKRKPAAILNAYQRRILSRVNWINQMVFSVDRDLIHPLIRTASRLPMNNQCWFDCENDSGKTKCTIDQGILNRYGLAPGWC